MHPHCDLVVFQSGDILSFVCGNCQQNRQMGMDLHRSCFWGRFGAASF